MSTKTCFKFYIQYLDNYNYKKKFDNEQKPCVNFKISKPKQKLCNQLHATWMKVKDMKSMIMKGRDKKLIITKAFKFNFQLVAL